MLHGSACITVSEDSNGARHLARILVCVSKSKRIDIRHHLLRELVLRGKLDVVVVESEQQRADFLTKALAGLDFCLRRYFVMNI